MYVSIHIKHFIFPKLFHFLYHFCIKIQNENFKQTFSYWLFRKFTFYLIENSSYKVSNTIRWMNIWDFIYFWFMYFFFLFIFEISFFSDSQGDSKLPDLKSQQSSSLSFPKPWNYRQESPSPAVLLCSFFSKLVEKPCLQALFEWKLYVWSSTDHVGAKINIPTL